MTPAAKRFMAAFRAGADAQAMDALLAEVRRDERIRSDAQRLEVLAQAPGDKADEVAALLARARYLMETA